VAAAGAVEGTAVFARRQGPALPELAQGIIALTPLHPGHGRQRNDESRHTRS
jgi:hypothetical protein